MAEEIKRDDRKPHTMSKDLFEALDSKLRSMFQVAVDVYPASNDRKLTRQSAQKVAKALIDLHSNFGSSDPAVFDMLQTGLKSLFDNIGKAKDAPSRMAISEVAEVMIKLHRDLTPK